MQLKRNKEMEFETLKKSYKKQIIIGALAVCVIGGALTFNLTRAKYKVDKSIDLAKGTVNYSVPDLRVVAVKLSEDGTNYIDTNNIPTSGYTINTEKSMCKVYDGTTSAEDAPKDNNVIIEYNNGEINISHLTKRNTRCYLYFDKIVGITIDNIIASLNAKTTTPNFSNTATTDERVYSVSDGMYGGTSYYWRGAATTNYVTFANFCWRIVRINGDKTMRLIYDGITCHANGTNTAESIAKTGIVYNSSSNQSNYVGWTYTGTSQRTTIGTASNAKIQLESWYSTNITGTNATKVAQGKYCNDRNAGSGYSWTINGTASYYAAYSRAYIDYTPTLSCTIGDVYTLNVGLITADEIMYVGGCTQSQNTSYYLFNGKNYWTMSPFSWNGSSAVAFVVNTSGYLGNANVNYGSYGLRPVINLKADTQFQSGGDGTLNNPYVVQ